MSETASEMGLDILRPGEVGLDRLHLVAKTRHETMDGCE
jgi:hypothetical protein